jgi:hypothetical protein
LAETLAITEFYLLFTRNFAGWVHRINRAAGIIVGIYFVGIIGFLMVSAVLPITQAGEWRTAVDVIAVACYLIGGLPLIYIALQEFGWVNAHATVDKKLQRHAICVALFLVFGHIAMVTGMLDPTLFGYRADPSQDMPSMTHKD